MSNTHIRTLELKDGSCGTYKYGSADFLCRWFVQDMLGKRPDVVFVHYSDQPFPNTHLVEYVFEAQRSEEDDDSYHILFNGVPTDTYMTLQKFVMQQGLKLWFTLSDKPETPIDDE